MTSRIPCGSKTVTSVFIVENHNLVRENEKFKNHEGIMLKQKQKFSRSDTTAIFVRQSSKTRNQICHLYIGKWRTKSPYISPLNKNVIKF